VLTPDQGETWVVTDGKAGMENQCLGLAEAVGLPYQIKRIQLRAPWRWWSPQLAPAPLRALSKKGDQLAPPWPRLLIATGRASVGASIAVKRANPDTFTVQIQNPGVELNNFDLVVAPDHDRLLGHNVMLTMGALHRVTPKRLDAEQRKLGAAISHLPKPRVAVLVGGNNKSYRLDLSVARQLADGLAQMCDAGAGLAITMSRRTGSGVADIVRDKLRGKQAVIWDGTGDNPYFAYLALADAIVVTSDSVSMASEAVSTGKPVYVFDLPGGSAKFEAFHAALRRERMTRPFSGKVERWSYEPPRDTARVAAEVRRRLKLEPDFAPARTVPAGRA
jgi:mitochondrial fission protein ELM1